jgi:hypothetical protein
MGGFLGVLAGPFATEQPGCQHSANMFEGLIDAATELAQEGARNTQHKRATRKKRQREWANEQQHFAGEKRHSI